MFCSKKKTSRVFSCLILFRNCLFRLHPFQELSCQNGFLSGTVFSDWILFRNCLFRMDPFQELFSGWILFRNCFEQISYITCHDVSISKHRAQDPLQELSSETYPFQEVSLQNISFAGTVLETISFAETVFANLILYRNCLCRPYPLQELPLQIKFFTHRNCLFTLQPFKKLILGNHNLSGKASLQLSFSGKHSSRYLNILHKFHFVTFYNFL